jgi:hypothetical protein
MTIIRTVAGLTRHDVRRIKRAATKSWRSEHGIWTRATRRRFSGVGKISRMRSPRMSCRSDTPSRVRKDPAALRPV